MSAPALELRDVSIAYGREVVVRGVSLQLAPGELHAVLGASGSGKTTLLRAVAGFEPVASGCIRLSGAVADDGRTRMAPEARHVGVVFQDYALFAHLDVAGNVAFGRKGMSAGELAALLTRVGLQGYEGRHVSDLSGGEQQRVALARTLAHEPQLILLDEPFSNLNRDLRRTLRTATARILREQGVAALLVTHDAEEAFAMADRISVLHRGELLQSGTPAQLYLEPRTLEVASSTGDVIVLAAQVLAPDEVQCALGRMPVRGAATTRFLVRPEQLRLRTEGPGTAARVIERRFLGASEELELVLQSGELLRARVPADDLPQSVREVRVEIVGLGTCVAD